MAEDEFVDAPSDTASLAPPQKASAPTIVASFDDGGEPDFEGWLKAQAQAKSKGPLPKGLAKPSTQANGRSGITRTITTGSVGSGVGTKKLVGTTIKPKPSATKVISTKPKDADDDWGDAWD